MQRFFLPPDDWIVKKNFRMPKLLLDANLSSRTAVFLRTLGFDVISMVEEGLVFLPDEHIMNRAIAEDRIVITNDLDFAHLWYFKCRGEAGVIHLRLKDQFVDSVNNALKTFFKKISKTNRDISHDLVIIKEKSMRIISATDT